MRAIFREMVLSSLGNRQFHLKRLNYQRIWPSYQNADVDITFGLAIILNGKPYLPNRIAVLPVFLGFYDLVWTISHMFGIAGFIRRDDIRRDESRLYMVDGCHSRHYVLITIPFVETPIYRVSRFIASPMNVVVMFGVLLT